MLAGYSTGVGSPFGVWATSFNAFHEVGQRLAKITSKCLEVLIEVVVMKVKAEAISFHAMILSSCRQPNSLSRPPNSLSGLQSGPQSKVAQLCY